MYKYLQYLQERAVAFSSFLFSIKRWDVLETHTFTRTHIRRTTKVPDDGTGKKTFASLFSLQHSNINYYINDRE